MSCLEVSGRYVNGNSGDKNNGMQYGRMAHKEARGVKCMSGREVTRLAQEVRYTAKTLKTLSLVSPEVFSPSQHNNY